MTKKRWPNLTCKHDPILLPEKCNMTKFARTVNLNWLSLTEINVYSPLDLVTSVLYTLILVLYNSIVNVNFDQTQYFRFTVLDFGQVTKVFSLLFSVILQVKFGHLFFIIWTSLYFVLTLGEVCKKIFIGLVPGLIYLVFVKS